jgi:hypothetical protein
VISVAKLTDEEIIVLSIRTSSPIQLARAIEARTAQRFLKMIDDSLPRYVTLVLDKGWVEWAELEAAKREYSNG